MCVFVVVRFARFSRERFPLSECRNLSLGGKKEGRKKKREEKKEKKKKKKVCAEVEVSVSVIRKEFAPHYEVF